jgi:hypothetical protein
MTENRRGSGAPLTPGEEDIIGALHLLGGLEEILLAGSIASEAPNERYNPTSGLFVTLVGMVGQITERVHA